MCVVVSSVCVPLYVFSFTLCVALCCVHLHTFLAPGRSGIVVLIICNALQKNSQNPGFDFSNADFNGMVPDAASFMGGVKHS